MDERTNELLGQLQHISTVRAADIAACYSRYLDLEAVAFLNDDPASMDLLVLEGGDVLGRVSYRHAPIWEYEGNLEEWVVELHSDPSSVPEYLCHGTSRLVKRSRSLYPPVPGSEGPGMHARIGMDDRDRIHSWEAAPAIAYARNLCSSAAEHGIDAVVAVAAVIRYADHIHHEERFLRPKPLQSSGGGT